MDKEIKYEEVIKDLLKFADKSNAMMFASGDGIAPQILKMCLLKTLIDSWFKEAKKKLGNKIVKDAESCIEKFIDERGEIKVKEGKDLEGFK